MQIVFIDESGDYGFENKKGTSKFFVIGATIFKSQLIYDIRRIIKKAKEKLPKKEKKKLVEIKATNSNYKIKKFVINKLIEYDLNFYFNIIDKSKIYKNSKLKKNYGYFYNYSFRFLLEKLIKDFGNNENFTFIFDGRKKGIKKYIDKLIQNKDIPEINYEIKGIDSKSETAICSIDFPVWIIFKKYENNNLELYESIKYKIKLEKIFPK